MKRLFRILLKLLVSLAAVAVLALAAVYVLTERRMGRRYTVDPPDIAIPTDEASIERGRHIAHNVSACVVCHGPDLGGHVLPEGELPPGSRLAAANLTRGKGGVGSRYTDKDWVRSLLYAVAPDGRPLIFMPAQDYHFTEQDLGALIAYLKTLPPVDRELPPPQIGMLVRVLSYVSGFPLIPYELIDRGQPRLASGPPPESLSPVERGRRLVGASACTGCHREDFTGGAGPPPGAPNITPARLAGWTEADFLRIFRERRKPDGTALLPQMPAQVYAGMSDDELKAIWAYLRTVPAKE
ncbi:MAG TPA: c-type cytochrome [Vicinamibacterales bacterium]|nr:c-type cytochrome [Vicinamibacterales bacterium]